MARSAPVPSCLMGCHPNMAPTFLLLYAITNEMTVKLTQIDRVLAALKT